MKVCISQPHDLDIVYDYRELLNVHVMGVHKNSSYNLLRLYMTMKLG